MLERRRGGVRRAAIVSVGAALATVLPVTTSSARDRTAGPQDPLLAGFRTPPPSARPRVWWHWMNGNITREGIRKDLEWMKRIGIGGLQAFDANLATPKVVDDQLAYMTPAWKDAFRYAADTSDKLGLELAIASSPGWSETGGPWVPAKDGLKKLVWSETTVVGGRRLAGQLAAPPATTGPYQAIPSAPDPMATTFRPPAFYADVAVLAYPLPLRSDAAEGAMPRLLSSSGQAIDGRAVLDDDVSTSLAVPAGTAERPASVTIDFGTRRTMRSASIFVPVAPSPFSASPVARLEADDAGAGWHPIVTVELGALPVTAAFRPVTASRFRLVFAPDRSFKLAQFRLSAESRVDRAEAKAAYKIARNYYALETSAAAADQGVAPDRVIDLTNRMRPDGSLEWTPPRGDWRILRLGYSLTGATNHPAAAEATGLEVDKFDPVAVRDYLKTYLGMYEAATGPGLIGAHGVRALLTDSIEVGPANWTPRLVAAFTQHRGYDPTPWLPAITGALVGSRAQSDAFLFDFRRTLADLMASAHYGTVAQVAHEHGLTVYGEALEDHRPVIGDDMAMRSHADVPMAAMWDYARGTEPKATFLADIRSAASVAHLYGQNLVAAESLTSLAQPWSDTPADLRRVMDLEFANGVNRPVIHTSVHQPLDKPPGLSLFFIGQFFNRLDSWAEMAGPWVEYMARNGFMLQQGRAVADVAYFYGEEAPLTGLYGDRPASDLPLHYGYDFVNADALIQVLSVSHGKLVAKAGAQYALLYLGGSSSRMTLPTLRRIAALAQAGAVIVGDAPTGSPSLLDAGPEYRALVARLWSGAPVTPVGKGRVIAGQDVERALSSTGSNPDFTYVGQQPDTRLLFAHRHLDDGEIYFVSNRQNRQDHAEAHFRVAGRQPEIWRADTGTATPVSYRIEGDQTVVSLDMGPEDSFFVVFRKPAARAVVNVPTPDDVPATTLDGAWDVAFQPGRGAPTATRLPALASLSKQADPGIRYFSGVATYTKEFTLPRAASPGRPLTLDLGEFGDVAEVRVNGRLVGTVWHAPHRIDIGEAVRAGRNSLDVRVANAWVNRLIGDAQPGATKIAFTTIAGPSPTTTLRPSGLIGPVTLAIRADLPAR